MDKNNEFDIVDETVLDVRETDTTVLSLGDLDMVGGGASCLVFG
jgi:hypothetical protein